MKYEKPIGILQCFPIFWPFLNLDSVIWTHVLSAVDLMSIFMKVTDDIKKKRWYSNNSYDDVAVLKK